FTTRALDRVHKLSGGIPRLINLICDRALLAGFSEQAHRITPEMIGQAAASLDVQPPHAPSWMQLPRASIGVAASVALVSSVFGAGITAVLYDRFTRATTVKAAAHALQSGLPAPAFDALKSRDLPLDAGLTILVGSYPTASPRSSDDVRDITNWLE